MLACTTVLVQIVTMKVAVIVATLLGCVYAGRWFLPVSYDWSRFPKLCWRCGIFFSVNCESCAVMFCSFSIDILMLTNLNSVEEYKLFRCHKWVAALFCRAVTCKCKFFKHLLLIYCFQAHWDRTKLGHSRSVPLRVKFHVSRQWFIFVAMCCVITLQLCTEECQSVEQWNNLTCLIIMYNYLRI